MHAHILERTHACVHLHLHLVGEHDIGLVRELARRRPLAAELIQVSHHVAIAADAAHLEFLVAVHLVVV